MKHPLYGQADAGAIWNRTFNEFCVRGNPHLQPHTGDTHAAEIVTVEHADAMAAAGAPAAKDDGLGFDRCPHDPCVYSRTVGSDEDRVTMPIYVDDGRLIWDPTPAARTAAKEDIAKLTGRFDIKFGDEDPIDDYFLGANRTSCHKRDVITIRATSYIDAMVERYLNGSLTASKEQPSSWSHVPADDALVHAYETAIATRTPADARLYADYNSLVGSLRHAVKYRPEISAAMDLLGCCLTFPTQELLICARRVLVYLGRTRNLGTRYSKHAPRAYELHARADANWRTTRSTSGWVIFLAGAGIAHGCLRQGCISMSTTEAELVALADCAIELIYVLALLNFLGYEAPKQVVVETDNKGAYDLCHRYTSAQHSRHIDRKLFKMRELRGAGTVAVKYVPTDENTADLFTKILSRQPFEKHRKTTYGGADV